MVCRMNQHIPWLRLFPPTLTLPGNPVVTQFAVAALYERRKPLRIQVRRS